MIVISTELESISTTARRNCLQVQLNVRQTITKYLCTESEVCTMKYLPKVFVQTEQQVSEVCVKKPKANTFLYGPSKQG